MVVKMNNIFLNLDTLYSQFHDEINHCTIKNQEKKVLLQIKHQIKTKRYKELLNQLQELFTEETIRILPKEKIIEIQEA